MEHNQVMERKFFADIAASLGRREPLTQAPDRKLEEVGPPVFWREQDKLKDKSLELFKVNLEALTGRVEIVKNKTDAQQRLREWVAELKAGSLIAWDHPELKELVNPQEPGLNIKFWNKESSRQDLIKFAAQADIGLTWADYAIAYTGSLVVFSGENQGRSVSLLPPTHIAVLKRAQIVPTMSTVLKKVKEKYDSGLIPASFNMITGPSRSADIEMDLSIGVHGPYRVWVIVMDT
ncbi:MAG: LutC/YkgG family protein [Peptococcaceae bacterium]